MLHHMIPQGQSSATKRERMTGNNGNGTAGNKVEMVNLGQLLSRRTHEPPTQPTHA